MARILDFADGFESSSEPTSVPFPATQVSVTPSGNLASTTAQAAFVEHQSDIDSLNNKIGTANGIASLDSDGKVPAAQIPAVAIIDVYAVADITARDALTVQEGDVSIVADAGSGVSKTYIYNGSSWLELLADGSLAAHQASSSAHAASAITVTPSGNLSSSTGQAALVELQLDIDTRATSSALSTHIADVANPHTVTKTQVGLGNVDNTSDSTKNSAAVVLTNKDIDGGTASNTNRLTLPKNTKSNLDGLSRKEGTVVYASDEAKPYYDNGSALVAFGTGSGGNENYVTNPKATTDASSTGVYNDGSVTRPVDGTGGSATVTIARNTTNALDTTDFLLTKPASNVQGQGYSWDVVIPRKMRGKVVQININYEVASGTYSGGSSSTDSDLIAYIYSVTDSKLIEPAPMKLDGGVSGVQYKYTGTFQTSTTDTSLRLLLHHATTSASAFTMKVTTEVSPQVVSIGGSIGDWQDYTPASTQGFGSPTITYAQWRRVGGSVQIRVKFTTGTVTASEARFGLPTGITSASTIPTLQIADGFWNRGTSSTAHGGAMLIEPSVTYLTFAPQSTFSSTSSNGIAKGTANAEFNSTEVISFFASLPVSGWGSSQVLSSETDTRVVSLKAYKNSGSVGAGAVITSWTAVNKDTHGGFDLSTGLYTVRIPGDYYLDFNSVIGSGTAGAIWIRVNGVNTNYATEGVSSGGYMGMSQLITDLKAGDTVGVYSGNAVGFAADNVSTVISLFRLSGPSQIAASETVAMRAQLSSFTHSSSGSVVTVTGWATPAHDTHTAFTTSTGIYKVPVAGLYRLGATVGYASGTTGARYFEMRKNGTNQGYSMQLNAGSTGGGATPTVIGSVPVKCLAGDELTIAAFQNQGTNLALATGAETYISIERVGN